MEAVHTPVLLDSSISFLSPAISKKSFAFMCDSTLGEGGHSEAFLSKFENLSIVGIDADKEIQSRAKERLLRFGDRMHFFTGWSKDFYKNYPSDFPKPCAILFDLGISIFHYELSGRGFSFRNDEVLDMRLNSSSELTAQDIVNNETEENLANIIYAYGEEKLSRRIAASIVRERAFEKIVSSKQLSSIIYDAVPEYYRHAHLHPATRTFQALRIAVNGELENLLEMISSAFNVLEKDGRLAVITFHSLEDRIVKNYFKNLSKKCVCPKNFPKCLCGGSECAVLVTKKPVLPTEEEIKMNAPSRSAKLRVVEKIKNATEYHALGVNQKVA